jgi:hypothetical protein
MADVNRWNDAIGVWKEGIPMADPKRAGFMAMNIGVAYEVLGDLPNALKYAQDAYILYGNKDARNYVNTLRNRQSDEERLKDQR